MRILLTLLALGLLAGCGGLRSFTRTTPVPMADLYACSARQLKELGYQLELEDSVGRLLQGRREIKGLVETARRGAAVATGVVTVGLAGGNRTRYDELTIFMYQQHYPRGNALEATAGMVTVAGEAQERSSPTDAAKADARKLLAACAPRR